MRLQNSFPHAATRAMPRRFAIRPPHPETSAPVCSDSPKTSLIQMTKRSYTRRTEQERISELEDKIRQIRERMEHKKRKDSEVLKELPKVKRALNKFAQLAADNERNDLANSCVAFLAGLDRAAREVPAGSRQTQSHDNER